MSKLYDFTRLVNKYSKSFEVVYQQDGGSYVGGKYVSAGTVTEAATGAIIPMSERKIYGSGGTYTAKDRQLIMLEPVKGPLKGVKVRYKGCEYSVEQETDHTDYSDVNVYWLKWVSNFD